MKCRNCGREFPSKYYFYRGRICKECVHGLSGRRTRRTDEAGRATEAATRSEEMTSVSAGEDEAVAVTVNGHALECPVCGHDRFWSRWTLMNTPGALFWGVAWANRQAKNYVCDDCGHILWFFNED